MRTGNFVCRHAAPADFREFPLWQVVISTTTGKIGENSLKVPPAALFYCRYCTGLDLFGFAYCPRPKGGACMMYQ
jgi:hypothetical protein